MDAKHAPGPWRVSSNVHGIDDFDDSYVQISSNNWFGLAQVVVKVGDNKDAEGEANARLIAAAPELLEALEFVAADPCFKHLGSVTHDVLRAAIAKATGQ